MLLIWGAITHFAGGMAGLFAPENALRSLQEMLAHGELVRNIAISLSRVAVGLWLAMIVGIPCGLLIGCSAASERLAMPALQFLRMISPLSWMPVAVMLLGIGDRPIWFLLSFAAVWPVLLNTASGVRLAIGILWIVLVPCEMLGSAQDSATPSLMPATGWTIPP